MTVARAQLGTFAEEALTRRARHAYPLEVCGFIMSSADPDTDHYLFEVPNIAKDPEHHWLMGEDYMRLAYTDEENIFGVYHTHPNGPEGPSEVDLRYVPPDMRMFVATRNGVYEYGMEKV